ncbi:hypothetical protein GCM10009069_30080 [Algimonas arctica]|uniref:Uncharacterized protein n=1 Tax=Algimonas arctica TaxID=1479486 RepID=A0A8J3G3K9_9PROT|nr:WG repeat-containing protein [Algimonas arctica]GHB05641.1 hypothetical protein GCM10009069_30080 [Algimonas arctica]
MLPVLPNKVSTKLGAHHKTATLARKDLVVYPDLLKRFNDLKPLKVDISYNATLRAAPKQTWIGNAPPYFNDDGTFTLNKTVKDITLLIGRSGKRTEGMSPGSPSYFDFMDIKSSYHAINPGKDAEQRLSSTFNNTASIYFSNARISEVRIPNREIKEIYDAFESRKNDCTLTVNKQSFKCIGEAVKSIRDAIVDENDAKTTTTEGDDFWSGESEEELITEAVASENPQQDDFWDRVEANEEDIDGATIQDVPEDSFWTDSADRYKNEGSSAFWNGGGEANTDGFEIQTDGGTQGVVSSLGEILIPFRIWEVLSYKSGLAEVRLKDKLTGDCHSSLSSLQGWDYEVSTTQIGYVDASGDWVTPPEGFYTNKAKEIDGRAPSGFRLTSKYVPPANETASQRRAREAKEERYALKREREKERARIRAREVAAQLNSCQQDVHREMERIIVRLKNEGYRHE